jgi:hypothetical protein
MKKIKPLEPFEMSGRIFTYEEADNGSIRLKQVKESEIKAKRTRKPADEFIPPTLEQVKEYFKQEGYLEEIAIRSFNHYQKGDWHDGYGKKVKNWKQKIYTNWMKPEHKIKESGGGIDMVM